VCLSRKPGVATHQTAMEAALALFRRSRSAYARENMPGHLCTGPCSSELSPSSHLFFARSARAFGCIWMLHHAVGLILYVDRERQGSGSAVAALHLFQSSPADQRFPHLAQLCQVRVFPVCRW